MKLTKKTVDGLPLPEEGQMFVWDEELKGFGLRLTPAGKTFIAQARVKDGKERRISLGKYGVITTDEARKKARKTISAMRDGNDPVTEKKRREAYSLTLRELTEKYIEDRPSLKETSRADIRKHLDKGFGDWAEKPAMEITRDKVAVRFRELSKRSEAQANQAFRILRAILNYARATFRPDDKPIIIENPVSILSDAKLWNKIRPRSGRIPTDRIGTAWNVLQGLREAPERTAVSRTLADIASFLLLTGARWSEAAELTWDRVNLGEHWWYLPDPKNRNPVKFPLSDVARAILEARPKGSKFVFPGKLGGHINDPRGPMEKISKVAGQRVTAHDLRRTFRAIAGECQIELWKTKLLMNHKMSQDVTIWAYTETNDLRYLAAEINEVATWILHQATAATCDNVVQIKRK